MIDIQHSIILFISYEGCREAPGAPQSQDDSAKKCGRLRQEGPGKVLAIVRKEDRSKV